MKLFPSCGLSLLLSALPAVAAVTVSTPVNGTQVGTSFNLIASASACSSQSIVAMGYSLDSSSQTTIVSGASVNASVSAALGGHTLHVKSWGNAGASCYTNVAISVVAQPPAIVVSTPVNSAQVTSPFALSAIANPCSSQSVGAMGYSLDNSSTTYIVNGTAINAQVSAPIGAHTLHVKSWGTGGAACVSSVPLTIIMPPGPSVPSTATVVSNIQGFSNWTSAFDTGTSGSAWGIMSLVNLPSLSGSARSFVTNYSGYAGERYQIDFGADTSATNFLYDTWLYVAAPSTSVANVEMDMNQVMSNGQTVIYGFQCDGWSGTWDYTKNAGTPSSPIDVWVHSTATCNPRNWSTNAWHHVQIAYSRDSSGNVTYKSVWLDNVEQDLNVTVPSAFALGWRSVLLTNFQVDGATSTAGTNTIYMDKLTISRW